MKLPVLLLAIAAILGGCGDDATSADAPRSISKVESDLVEADNAFGFKLFARLAETEEESVNLFISPLSISMALGMTLNGAEGATRDSMERTLELAGLSRGDINAAYRSLIDLLRDLDPAVRFQIANSIWYRQGLDVRQEFIDTNEHYFDAVTRALDFADAGAAAEINAWVRENTNGKIESIAPDPIPSDLVMFLINAIYFKGDWTVKFEKKDTQQQPFTLADGSTVQVPLMFRSDENLRHYEDDDVIAVDLPYGNGLYSMTAVLPKHGSVDSLAATITPEKWNGWVNSMRQGEGRVYLPRFSTRYETALKDVLVDLGMGLAFSDAADFTGIRETGGLAISEVRHKTFVEVNEEGTEAAAVTSVEIRTTSVQEPFTFRADRPFLFAIRERNSGAVLFIGAIRNPAFP